MVRTATGGTATFPEADCTCPVLLGPSIANLAGGNMQGSCEPPGPDTIWPTYQPRPNIPQALTNWIPTLPEAKAPPLFCPKSLNLGNQLVNCFSFLCDSQTYINNVPVVTCHCPIGESLAGTPVSPATAFFDASRSRRSGVLCRAPSPTIRFWSFGQTNLSHKPTGSAAHSRVRPLATTSQTPPGAR